MSKPWNIVFVKEHPVNVGEQWAVIQTETYAFDVIAVENSDVTRIDFEEKAKLIAAAPDLLEACHKLMEANAIMARYIVDNDIEFTVDTGIHAYTLASNAIKKATE